MRRMFFASGAATLVCWFLGQQPTSADDASGKKVYEQRCAACHGEKGDGKGEVADLLYPAPRDFTSGVFKIRSTPTGTLPLDEDLSRTISEGMPGTPMMPFKEDISEEELRAVVSFIKTFSDKWKSRESGSAVQIGSPPAKTRELVALGKKVYADLGCADCHGGKGRGDGPSANKLKDALGMPILPYDFTESGRMKGGHTVSDIYRTFMTGLDGTPMPSYDDSIPDEKDRWALAYYVESLGGGKPPAQTVGRRVIAKRYAGELPLDPMNGAWRSAAAVNLPVQRLWAWTEGKTIESIDVRAMHDGSHVAVLVEWDDPKLNQRLSIDDFTDAAAIQFPLSVGEDGKPFFGMGDHKQPVEIWRWRADAQLKRMQEAKPLFPNPLAPAAAIPASAVETLNASAPGTLTSLPQASQHVEGKGVWAAGKWHVVFQRTLSVTDPGHVDLQVGRSYPVAFAVWDGGASDRDGRKAVTAWQVLDIK